MKSAAKLFRTETSKRALVRLKRLYALTVALAPVRPVVLIQSDDWGRVGIHDPKALDRLRGRGLAVGASRWDYYGHENAEDLRLLGDVLVGTTDVDGRPACLTANLVMANADIRRMRSEGFGAFRFVPVTDGLPEPWAESSLLEQYRSLIAERVFYPGLHGFTHFSPEGMLRGWHDTGEYGERTRSLLIEDIPYLASVTPEFNFALLDRSDGTEVYADYSVQRDWVGQGVQLFQEAFGYPPVTTCAPGYRCNDATFAAWADFGIRVVQTAGSIGVSESDRLMVIERNVAFEPLLDDEQVVEKALSCMDKVVAAGWIPVICTHSINYISRYCAGRANSLQCLARLLREVKNRFPDMRFAHDADVLTAYRNRDPAWFRSPRMQELAHRRRLARTSFSDQSE
jgi:hypothetical protein